MLCWFYSQLGACRVVCCDCHTYYLLVPPTIPPPPTNTAAQQHTHGIPSLLTPSQHANTTAIHHLGVHYSFIPGCLTPQLRRKPLCGGLHLWLKAVRHYETHATTEQQASLSSHQPVTWRRSHLEGFYFFEEARQPRLWANLKLENPSLLLQHPLFMTITDDASASRSIVHPVTTYQPVDAYRPGWLQASIPTTIETTHHVSKIPNTALHNDYTLFIEDWARHVTLSHVLQSAEPWQSVSPTAPDVYTVIGQFYRIPVDQAAQYIAVHTEYHRHLGAAGTLFYFNDEYLGLFAQAHRLHVLQQQRVLHMVPWPYLNLIEGAHTFDQVEYSHLVGGWVWGWSHYLFLVCLCVLLCVCCYACWCMLLAHTNQYPPITTPTQGVVFNHALLALWGRGAYVFMTDMDELLVTTYPSSVQGLLTGCFSMGDHITLEEYDTLCVDCLSDGGQVCVCVWWWWWVVGCCVHVVLMVVVVLCTNVMWKAYQYTCTGQNTHVQYIYTCTIVCANSHPHPCPYQLPPHIQPTTTG